MSAEVDKILCENISREDTEDLLLVETDLKLVDYILAVEEAKPASIFDE